MRAARVECRGAGDCGGQAHTRVRGARPHHRAAVDEAQHVLAAQLVLLHELIQALGGGKSMANGEGGECLVCECLSGGEWYWRMEGWGKGGVSGVEAPALGRCQAV